MTVPEGANSLSIAEKTEMVPGGLGSIACLPFHHVAPLMQSHSRLHLVKSINLAPYQALAPGLELKVFENGRAAYMASWKCPMASFRLP
jgi:hypothetical protein